MAFGASSNLRTLTPRLARALADSLPLIEIEAVYLSSDRTRATIQAHAVEGERTWTGQRSARFFERETLPEVCWADPIESARAASIPVEAQLFLPVGHNGFLRLSFDTDISCSIMSKNDIDMLVSVLASHARRLAQLEQTARCCLDAHRYIGEIETQLAAQSKPKPEPEPVTKHAPPPQPLATKISPELHRFPLHSTDMKVMPLDVALAECISGALRASRGKIYGQEGAAQLLGLKPSTLQSKMRKLGIERSSFVPH